MSGAVDVGEPAATARPRTVLDRLTADPLNTALAAVPVLILLVGAWVHRFINEDGFINFHIVQHIDAGHGPVFNPGERVEAYTSPLFIVVLTVVRALFGWAASLPKLAVAIGLIFTTASLVLGMLGATRIAKRLSGRLTGRDGRALFVPFGALLIACTPPMWRWATSGLETSLSFVWLALCFWALVRRYDLATEAGELSRADRPRWLLVVLGLGYLVRPDFVLYSICFVVALFLTSQPSWKARLRALAWAAALPVAYQIFRMGYFAAIVPNTALAKSADSTHWDWGFEYAKQFLGVEWLWVALVAVVALLAVVCLQTSRVDRRALAVVLAPVAGAVLQLLYVQKVGGDYMYARFYVPAFVALILPVAVVAVPRPIDLRSRSVGVTAVAGAVLVLWSVAAMINGKILDANTGLVFGDYGMLLPGATNPVEPEDYGFSVATIDEAVRKAKSQPDLLIDSTDGNHKDIPLQRGQGLIIISGAIGASSFSAGTDIWIIDNRGLADSIGSRIQPNTAYGYAGHERLLSYEWSLARWTVPSPNDSGKTALIRKVLTCPDLQDLDDATTEPMSFGRFFKNIALSRKLSSLRLNDDPIETEKNVCPS